ncbi:AraC family transcriptional regulator [Alteromonas sp. BL110]|nr:AraC family transcriptional regulator [Alteromonas sp. BL110]RKM80954.1 helix-turn-helix domain-containing protein [Alteromonas sp. BL110]
MYNETSEKKAGISVSNDREIVEATELPSLSVRSYARKARRHAHPFYQLVLPVNGHIEIVQDYFTGSVGVGEGVCIAPLEVHSFSANENAKFVVADLLSVPVQLQDKHHPIFQVNTALQAFLSFVEVQLTHYAFYGHDEMTALFQVLLAKSEVGTGADKRITQVISHIHGDLGTSHTLQLLSEMACMGTTQFKTRFKQATGLSLRDYLVKIRMEKAKALLRNTDTPMSSIAQITGYEDVAAFSRRFKAYFGQPPKSFKRK